MVIPGDITNPQRWNKYAYALNNPLRFIDPDGAQATDYFVIYNGYMKQGGDRSWRTNNPGNLNYGTFAIAHGAIKGDMDPSGRSQAIFPTMEAGAAAQVALWNTTTYQSMTLEQAITAYAPPSENDTQKYIDFVAAGVGVPANTKISDLTPDQLQRLLDFQRRMEGQHPGTTIVTPPFNPGPWLPPPPNIAPPQPPPNGPLPFIVPDTPPTPPGPMSPDKPRQDQGGPMRIGIVTSLMFQVIWASTSASASDQAIRLLTNGGAVETAEVKAEPGKESANGARICASAHGQEWCYSAIANGKPFPLNPDWKAIFESDHSSTARYLLFTAQQEPFLSRQNTLLALLALNPGSRDLRNELPVVVLSEQSQHSIWRDSHYSPLPILTTADFQWDMEHETHFGPHQYRINTYVSTASGKYVLADTYLTQRQYPGLDDAAHFAVIEGEMDTIREHLSRRHRWP